MTQVFGTYNASLPRGLPEGKEECRFVRLPAPFGRYWSMAESEDGGAPASLSVTAQRDAFAAGRDLHVRQEHDARAGNEGGPGAKVDRSVGVQVGSGNVQVNNYYDGTTPDADAAAFPAQLAQRAIRLHDGLNTGTMLAIEIRARRELEHATVVMTGVTGPEEAAIIPPPARLYWHPSREGGGNHDRPGRFRARQYQPGGADASRRRDGDS